LLDKSGRAGFRFTREELEEVVLKCEKQRFAIDDANEKIRANQGHSTEVELEFEPTDPLGELYHGTARRFLEGILNEGLKKMARHHVHLSSESSTALKVGQRHGNPVILRVDSLKMKSEGHIFFRSANGVWLVDSVPPEYLRVWPGEMK